MELSIAFLQLLPEGDLTENRNKGIKACREAKERGVLIHGDKAGICSDT